MSDSPDPDKLVFSFRIHRTIHARVCRMAEERNERPKDTAIYLLSKGTEHVVLQPDDYIQIAKETQEAIDKNNAKHGRGGCAPGAHKRGRRKN